MSTGNERIPACLVQADANLAAELLLIFYEVLLAAGTSSTVLALSLIGYIMKSGRNRDPSKGKDHRPISSLGVNTSSLHWMLSEHVTCNLRGRAPEQFAEKQGFGTDLAVLLLTTLIQMTKGPLYLGLVDIEAAYDMSWKEGVWFKLNARGVRERVWKALQGILKAYPTKISCEGEVSELIQILVGLPQGSALSGLSFTAFLDDLAGILKEEGFGVNLLGIILVGIFFMDDLTVPALTAWQLQKILNLLAKYGETWRLLFSPKSFVLACDAPDAPEQWKLGDLTIKTEEQGTMLGVVFSGDRPTETHMRSRMGKAWNAWHAASSVSLVGGNLSHNDQTMFVTHVVWATLDYGRHVAPAFGYGHRKLRDSLDTMMNTMMRAILGASPSAPVAGMLGEVGWCVDSIREAWVLLRVERKLLTPSNTWAKLLSQHANEVPFFRTVRAVRENLELPSPEKTSKHAWKSAAKMALIDRFTQEWRGMMERVPSLWLYRAYKREIPPPVFAREQEFPGRQELSKARIADIDVFGLLVPYVGGWRCPRCPMTVPGEYKRSCFRNELLYHLVLGCATVDAEIFHSEAWFPGTWETLQWYQKLAHLLQLTGVQTVESARSAGRRLEATLREVRRAKHSVERARKRRAREDFGPQR